VAAGSVGVGFAPTVGEFDGKYQLGLHVGLAAGIGGAALDFNVGLDKGMVDHGVVDGAHKIADTAVGIYNSPGGQFVAGVAEAAPGFYGQMATDAAHTVAHGATGVGHTIADGTVGVGNTIAHGTVGVADTIAHGTVGVGNTIAHGTTGAANTVAHGATDTANTVAHGATNAANTVAHGTTNAANTVAHGATDTAL